MDLLYIGLYVDLEGEDRVLEGLSLR
jgi:hypothetical protein